jgi:holin-like protein
MIRGFAILLVFQLAGELASHLLSLPVPGPVVGMVLLLVALELRPARWDDLRAASGGLLSHLSLLFVPAGVGVVQHLPRLAAEWLALALALLVSTAATLAVTGLVAARLLRRPAAGGEAR